MAIRKTGTVSDSRRPRVGLDLHAFDGPPQGIRSHVLGLFPEVIARCPEIEFVLFASDQEGLQTLDPSWGLPNVKRVNMPYGSSARRLLWQLPRLVARHRVDLLHVQYVSPPLGGVPTLVTLHDVLFESHPQLFAPLFRLRSRILMRRSARRAEHVLTVSDYSKAEIQRRYGLAPSGVSVVHNAVDRTRFFPGTEDLSLVRGRGLHPKGYILNVGRLERRKNLTLLVRAHAALGTDAPPLVLAGRPGQGTRAVLREIARHGERERVMVLQDVTDRELPALLRHAQIFCYPSEAEGFGMPPLEAMASGTPVITANTTALPEVVGSAGLTVEPHDQLTLTRALERLIQRPAEREKFAAAGLQRARRFDWRNAADKLATIYRHCLDLPGPPHTPADATADVAYPEALSAPGDQAQPSGRHGPSRGAAGDADPPRRWPVEGPPAALPSPRPRNHATPPAKRRPQRDLRE